MSDSKEYRNIFKSTFLFGFVQIFNIAVKVGLNKTVALLLGTEGMGAISLFSTAIHLISTGAGLGINQSSVRDIADAKSKDNFSQISLTISFVKRTIRYTSILGIIVMAALSPCLSQWTFGNSNYTIPYLFLSLAVGATIQTNGYRAINTGMRELKNVALSTIWGSVAGLLFAVPLYFLLGDKGIVPSLIMSSIATLLIAKYYADKVKYEKVQLSIKETLQNSKNMIRMGTALMLMSLILTATQLVLSSFISNHGGLSIVGIYQAGATIVTSYFGIIISAMSTEYYPRISGFNEDNIKLKEAVNSQSEVGLLLSLPLIVIFIFLCPFFIEILYSENFILATGYLDYAIIGTITIICSNCMGMVLLAKQEAKLFLISSLLSSGITLSINIFLYLYYGLVGLGIGYAINGAFQYIMYNMIMKYKYDISFTRSLTANLLLSICVSIIAVFLRNFDISWLKWGGGCALLVLVTTYSFYILKNNMNINILKYITRKL